MYCPMCSFPAAISSYSNITHISGGPFYHGTDIVIPTQNSDIERDVKLKVCVPWTDILGWV